MEYRVRNIDFIKRRDGTYYYRAIFEVGKRKPLAYVQSRASEYRVFSLKDEYLGKGKYSKGAIEIYQSYLRENSIQAKLAEAFYKGGSNV